MVLLQLAEICGVEMNKKTVLHLVQASIDNGVTSMDTAPFYGFGLSEKMIGEAVKGYDRSKLQLLTKFGLVWDGSNAGKGEYFFEADENGKKIHLNLVYGA